ncbi:MAG: mevalonate kinase [Armatimonadota bacterium]
MIIRESIPARVGLVGNPSDGFYGKTIAFLVGNFRCQVTLWESPTLEIVPSPDHDPHSFSSLEQLACTAERDGYYGGIRLIFATCKKFRDYCRDHDIALDERTFTVTYDTDIPRQVGLAGSSAIVTATFRALMRFYGVTDEQIPRPIQPNVVLSVETEELGLYAGLQDRVVQVYGGMVYMDFDRDYIVQHGHGRYEPLDPGLLPPLFVAHMTDPSSLNRLHNDVRYRFENGDQAVHQAVRQWAQYAVEAKEALLAGDSERLGELMDANFDLRQRIYGEAALGEKNLEMIEIARKLGLPCKFTGSGGAVVGICRDPGLFDSLRAAYADQGYICLRALLQPPS